MDALYAPHAAAGQPRDRWFRDHLDTTLDRDLRDVSDALKLRAMPRLLRLLAAQAACLLNYKAVADRLQLHRDTVKSYTQALETRPPRPPHTGHRNQAPLNTTS